MLWSSKRHNGRVFPASASNRCLTNSCSLLQAYTPYSEPPSSQTILNPPASVRPTLGRRLFFSVSQSSATAHHTTQELGNSAMRRCDADYGNSEMKRRNRSKKGGKGGKSFDDRRAPIFITSYCKSIILFPTTGGHFSPKPFVWRSLDCTFSC